MQTLTFEIPSNLALHVTPDEFAAIAAVNRDLRLERAADGTLIVSPPTGGESGHRNLNISIQLGTWSEVNQTLGIAFDSSTGFVLPNEAIRAPDVSWLSRERWDSLSQDEKEGFVPLCPDFVIELRSKSDRLSTLQAKMREYIDNGARLGWLIDPQNRSVEIYRGEQDLEVLDNPSEVSGGEVLPGFTLNLKRVWG
ncbi:MAG: Uma2 family endonuclease [Cyanobacteria bacterium J06597_1]